MSEQALKILRRAAGKKAFDDMQARWDCAGLLGRYRATKALWHKSAKPARIMAEIAADTYHFHTDKFPGRAIPTKKKSTAAKLDNKEPGEGHYPDFIRALLVAVGEPCARWAVHNACQDARRKLNKGAGLKKLPRTRRGQDHAMISEKDYRNNKIAQLLATHVVGQDEMGFAELGGYEPAPDPERKATEVFAAYVKAQEAGG